MWLRAQSQKMTEWRCEWSLVQLWASVFIAYTAPAVVICMLLMHMKWNASPFWWGFCWACSRCSINADCTEFLNGFIMHHLSQAIIFSREVCSESGPLDSFILQQALKKKYLLIYLAVPGLSCGTWGLQSSLQVWSFFSVAAFRIFSCAMWDLVPWPGIKAGPPALGAWSLSHWTTREVPEFFVFGSSCLVIWKQMETLD